jgi:hypothetical protein
MAQGGLGEIASQLAIETRAVTLEGRRARLGLTAAVAVPLATVVALALQLDYPVWAGFYSWLVLKPAVGATIEDALRRMLATMVGACLGFMLGAGFAASHLLTHLVLFLIVTACVYEQMTGRRPVFWMMIALTMVIVTFDSLLTPQAAIIVAISRCLEVALGVAVGSLVAFFLLPDEPLSGAPPPMTSVDARFTALVAGLTVTLAPALWFPFQLQGMSAAGFAALLLPHPQEPIERFRALAIIAGVAIGGAVGLAAARVQGGELLPAFALMAAAIFVFGQIHLGGGRVALAGTFMGVGYLVTNVQGAAPTTDISTPIWFLASIVVGALIVLMVSRILSAITAGGDRPPTGSGAG